MTGREFDSDPEWEGPEWAAPESAERIASNPRRRRGGADFPLRLFVHKYVDGHQYLEMRLLEAAFARSNRGRAVPRIGEST